WGVCVDADPNDYVIGEDIMPDSTYTGLRNFANPASTSVMASQPVTYAKFKYTYGDQYGVHTNSGILNKAAYQMMVSPVIGRAKTEQLYYRAYDYLTPGSHFYDLREALKKAAEVLYPDEYQIIASAVNTIFGSVGIKTPAPSQAIKYYKDQTKYIWYYGYELIPDYYYYGFGSIFVPYYSGTLDGVDLRFKNTGYYSGANNNRVTIWVGDFTEGSWDLVYEKTINVTNFSSSFYVPLEGGVPFNDCFDVIVYPWSSNVALWSDDGEGAPYDTKSANYVELVDWWDNYAGAAITQCNFFIRPHVTYDSAEELTTPGFTQDGAKVTVCSEINRAGDAPGASIKFEASINGGGTWALKTTGTSSAGFCVRTLTLTNGTYKIRAKYDLGSTHLVSDPALDVVVQPVVAGDLADIVTTKNPVISWDAFDYPGAVVTGYEVQLSRSATFTTIDVSSGYAAGATSGTLPALALGVKYYWRIVALLETGRSVPSAAQAITYKNQPVFDFFDARESLLKIQPAAELQDSFGRSIPGRTIVFSSRKWNPATSTWSSWASAGSAKTNYLGVAYLAAAKTLTAGTYEIKAAFAGDAFYLPLTAGPATVTLPAAEQRGNLEVVVRDDAYGYFLEGATVQLYSTAAATTPVASMTTNASGLATFSNMSEGVTYKARITFPGWLTLNCFNIQVFGGATAGITPRLVQTGASALGKIQVLDTNDQPVAGATIKLRAGVNAYAGTVVKTAVTGADGIYTFSGVAAGVYTAEVVKAGYRSFCSTVYCGQVMVLQTTWIGLYDYVP
ncbi:MAG TPA: M4 family metallopeptidase, partial [Nitrospirota bacterium]|nr:M4 family metallopeptidase [Nitrospirota bacterium]